MSNRGFGDRIARALGRTAGVILGAGAISCAVVVTADAGERLSQWSPPVSLGSPVNTAFGELCPFPSKDGLSLYFFSNRPDGLGGNDIWVAERPTPDSPWGAPVNLGNVVNTPFDDSAPWLSRDGHALYFTSNRPGGFGGRDLHVARRSNTHDNFDWQAPENLGSAVNGPANDISPALFVDETGRSTLYFASDRPGGLGLDDIYASTGDGNGAFDGAILVAELSSPFADRLPGIRKDGLELLLTSDRPGTIGALDLWVSTRESPTHSWSEPENLGTPINTIEIDGCGRFADRRTVYFHSTIFGGFPLFDLYRTTRERISYSHGVQE